VFLEHHRRVFRAAFRVTGSAQDAEDVLQTVFLRLAQHPGGRAPINPASYLYRAAVNAALDLLRTRRAAAVVALDDVSQDLTADATQRPDRTHEAAEIRAWLRDALSRLHPRAAEMFALRYLEGYANVEIAGLLGASRFTVAVTLHRTRRRLIQDLRATRREMP
jgi:RNA polymerase sigma-70 factor, ECF subfamily